MSTLRKMEHLHLTEINLVRTYIAGADAYPMKNGGRAHYGILYTIEGEETYLFSDGAINASPNTVLFIPKNEIYSIELSGESSVVTGIEFEADGLDGARPFLSKFAPTSPLRSLLTPSASRQSRVAITSAQFEIPRTVLTPSLIAADMRSLCAMLFDGGADIFPLALPFLISTRIYILQKIVDSLSVA